MSNKAMDKVVAEVDGLPNLIKIVRVGKVDEVIRIVPLEARILELDRGPENEEWEHIKRIIFVAAPPDQKGLVPVPVGTKQEWTLVANDVPIIELVGDNFGNFTFSKKTREKMLEDKNRKVLEPKVPETIKRGPGRPPKKSLEA